MKLLAVGGALLVAGAAVLACGDDDDTGNGVSPTVDGGTSNDGGGSTSPDGTFACTAKQVEPVGSLPNRTANGMVGNATKLFGWYPDAIVQLPKAGGESTTLYAPTAGRVLGVLASGDDVYTAETPTDTDQPYKLVRISAATGAATTLVTRTRAQGSFGDLVAIDDTSIFYFHEDTLFRQPRAGGAPVEIAETGLLKAQVFGPDLILTGGLGSDVVWRVPRNAASKAEAVKLTDKAGCFGQLTAVEGGYYCAGTLTLQKLGPDFAPAEKIWDAQDGLDGETARLSRIVGIDGSRVFFSVGGAITVRAFDIGAPSTSIVGCGADGVLEGVVDTSAVYLRVMPADEDQPWPVLRLAR